MGIFDNDRIMKGMDIRFNYYSWIAWREEYNSDNLINEIKDTLQLWYPGNNFIEIDLKLDSKNNLAMWIIKLQSNAKWVLPATSSTANRSLYIINGNGIIFAI